MMTMMYPTNEPLSTSSDVCVLRNLSQTHTKAHTNQDTDNKLYIDQIIISYVQIHKLLKYHNHIHNYFNKT